MVRSVLSDADAREVEQAIARVETKSATELVVAIVKSSGDYFGWRVALSVAWAVGTTIALEVLMPTLPVMGLLVLQPLLAAGLYAVCGWEPIYRRLIPPDAAERAVAQRAFALFSERGVHRTRDRTGLLIVISALEHRVVILGDSGIHERVGDEGWAAQVSRLVTRIREGRAKQGLLEIIEHFEPLLTEVAPVRHDDRNELPDTVVRG